MMSQEQFQFFMQAVQGMAARNPQGLNGGGADGHGGGGGRIISKYFRSDEFHGDQARWDDWSFAFKRCVRSMNRNMFTTMLEWEVQTDEIDEDAELSGPMQDASVGVVRRFMSVLQGRGPHDCQVCA